MTIQIHREKYSKKAQTISLINLLISFCFCTPTLLLAETNKAKTELNQSQLAQKNAMTTLKGISKGVQELKSDVVSLSKDLRQMEEKLLFPSSTKYSVFVSMGSSQFFDLESVKLKLDGKLVVTHLYTGGQRESLSRGGIQRLYVTNLNEGKHTATVFFTGLGPNARPYKLANTLEFEKGASGEYLELAVRDDGDSQEPVIFLKQW